MASLYTFIGYTYPAYSTNGLWPKAGLFQVPNGDFYGSAAGGGDSYGTLFRFSTNNNTLGCIFTFEGGDEGGQPLGPLTLGSDGNFYGTASQFGPSLYYGTVFKVTTGGVLTPLGYFDASTGSTPCTRLVQGADGNLYGTTASGGRGGGGTIYRVTLNSAPKFVAETKAGNTLMLTWSAVAGKSYQLQSLADLTQTNWTSAGGVVLATNATATASDTVGSPGSKRFYRVLQLP